MTINVSRETIGPHVLYHGDALEILPQLAETADLVCCDPPYLLTSGGCTKGGLHERFGGGGVYGNSGEIVPCDIEWADFMPLLYAALKPNTQAYVMSNNRNVKEMLVQAEDAGFDFHNLLVWDKITATPNRWYMKNCEFTGFFYKGLARRINDCSAKQLIRCPQVDESIHPTEKPVALMRSYIEQSTTAGQDDLVLDPFAGSGTTGVAAAESGRRFIGIEKDEKYFDIAVRRLRLAVERSQERLL